MRIAERVAEITGRVAAATRAAGRAPGDVTLVAVCKRQPLDRILEAHDCGLRVLGESTAQGLARTSEALAGLGREVAWHFVGALQRNKVKTVLPSRPTIHSIDRLSLAEAISKRCEGSVDVLVQVNIGREPQKAGVEPEAAIELACAAARLPSLRIRGLMTLPPAGRDPAPYFDELRRLSEALQAIPEGRDAGELSMGMSDDFETAIGCGATLIRVGTALFGPREEKKE